MKKLLYILALIFIFALPVEAAIYTAYFSNAATGNATGTDTPSALSNCDTADAGACSTLTHAQAYIELADTGDTVTLKFDRGDTWSVDTTIKRDTHGLLIQSDDPIVHIDAYGSGAKPIFDGGVSDFSTADAHDAVNGPLRWSNLFRFEKDGCSIANVEMKNVYGNVVALIHANGVDNFTLQDSTIHNFGSSGIWTGVDLTSDCTTNTTVESNTFHTGQQLWRYGLRPSGWGAAISLQNEDSLCTDNLVKYNLVYDIYGEGIISHGGIVEYNIVGDTYSAAIYQNGKDNSSADASLIFRYNLVTSSSSATYRTWSFNGIGVVDENVGGDNSTGYIEIYGNVVINRHYGIYAKSSDSSNPLASLKIFNNTVIDSDLANYQISQQDEFDAGFIYNNASILYDRDGVTTTLSKHMEGAITDAGWTVSHNLFFTDNDATPTVLSGWTANDVTTNPRLYGEEKGETIDWDGQSGSTYYKDILFADVIPEAGSSLIDAGKSDTGYEATFLIGGTDFSVLPDTQTFVTAEQGDEGAGWELGAAIYSLSITNISPTDNGTNVAVGASITWTNPTGATSVTVFFDSTDGTTQVATGSLDTSYDPGGMTVETEYFWKVNVVHAGGTEVGTVYSFTTSTGPPTDPTKKATISYDSGGGSIEYDLGGMTIQ